MKRHASALTFVIALIAAGCGPAPDDSGEMAAESEPAAPAGPLCPIDRPVVFSGYAWESHQFHVAVAGFIIRNAFGCRTDVIPGETVVLLEALRRGDSDIAMEVWIENNPEIWNRMVSEGAVEAVGISYPEGVQGWWVPRYMIEGDDARGIEALTPDLKSVFDLQNYSAVFEDPEEPSKGRFYNCPAGWGCEIINTKKLYAYGLEDRYTNFRPGGGGALAAAIAGAYRRGQPILAYYWGPTSVLARHDLVMLEEPPYDPDIWAEMAKTDKPERAVANPAIEMLIGVNTRFKEQAPAIIDVLSRYRTDRAIVHEALAFMGGGGSAEDAARTFFKTREAVWTQWVSEEQADLIRAALEE